MESIYVNRLSWPEYEKKIADGAVIFLPVGATEQHGPHLPMATDAIFAERMAVEVARQCRGLVLPTLCYGYKSQARSGGGQTFTGTTSLDGQTLTATVLDILRELGRHGVTRVVIVNGHFENKWFCTEAIELVQREFKLSATDMKVVRLEYWDFTPQSVYDEIFDGPFPGVDLEHAALIETSMMLYWHPEYVNREMIPDHALADFPECDVYPQDGSNVPATGVLAPATTATADKGRLIIEATTERIVTILRSILAL